MSTINETEIGWGPIESDSAELCFHQDHFRFRPILLPQTLRNGSFGTSPVEKFRTYERIPEESGDKEPGQATATVERGSLVASFARSEFFNETASSVKSIRAS